MNDYLIFTGIIAFAFSLYALIKLFYKNYKKYYIPFYWILIIWFVPFVGPLLYFTLKPWRYKKI